MGCNIWYSDDGTGRARSPFRPLLAVPNVTAHPSTASVTITVLLCNGPLLCYLMCPTVRVCYICDGNWLVNGGDSESWYCFQRVCLFVCLCVSLCVSTNHIVVLETRLVVFADKLQRVLNAAARVVTITQKYDRGLTRIMRDELHWPGCECCRSQSTTIRQPPSSCRSPLQHEHIRPSGLLCRWPNGLELTARQALRPIAID